MCAELVRSHTVDAIVVGGGVIGLATAWELQRAGLEVLCLEAAEPGGGQSRGPGRVFRHLHGRDELVELSVGARERWDSWSAELGQRLVGNEGAIFTVPNAEHEVERLRRLGVDATLLSTAEQRARCPVFAGSPGAAVLDRRAGVIRTRETIVALGKRLGERLVRAVYRSATVDGSSERVEVSTDVGTFRCRHLVLAAGTATQDLARPLGIELDLEFRHHIRAAFGIREPGPALAAWTDALGEFGVPVYGAPLPESGRYVLGLNGVGRDATVPADHLRDPDDSRFATDLRDLRTVVERGLPGLDPAVLATVTCITTALRSGGDDFVLRSAGLVHAFAGNNVFKFAPSVAALIVRAVVSGERSTLLADRAV